MSVHAPPGTAKPFFPLPSLNEGCGIFSPLRVETEKMKNVIACALLALILASCVESRNNTSPAPGEPVRPAETRADLSQVRNRPLAAAASSPASAAAEVSGKFEPMAETKSERNKFLAYEHSLSLEAEDAQVKVLYGKLLAY